jgi:signal peptidase II
VSQATTDDPPRAPDVRPAQGHAVLLAGIALIVVVIDQVTKVLAISQLDTGSVVSLLGPWLQLRLVRNPGAAFSMGESLTWAFTILAALVVVGVILAAKRVKTTSWAFTLGLLVGGAAGNLADRLFRDPGFGRGHVVDFIDYAGRFVGNVADIAIVGAMVLMVFGVIRGIGLDGVRR